MKLLCDEFTGDVSEQGDPVYGYVISEKALTPGGDAPVLMRSKAYVPGTVCIVRRPATRRKEGKQ